MEIRLYFECLEQAYHYIYPQIQAAITRFKGDVDVKFVRKPRVLRGENSSLYAIYSLTTPDFLISLCTEDIEIPLITGEFSEAVMTEDHELQRSIVGIASALAGCIFLKISGQKESPREHGGRTEFDPFTVAKALQETLGYEGCIIAKWPTQQNNPLVIQRNPEFLSCPPDGAIPLAEQTMITTIIAALENQQELLNGINLLDIAIPYLRRTTEFTSYRTELRKAEGLDELILSWVSRSQRYGRRSRIYLDDETLIVKINRFSHAADPDRGILIFASSTVRARETLARYVVKNRSVDTLSDLFNRFLNQASEEGVPNYFLNGLRMHVRALPRIINEIDITSMLVKSQTEWQNNKVLSSLAYFADGLIIQTKDGNLELVLRWNRSKLIMLPGEERIEEALVRAFGFRNYGTPLSITEVSDVNEDEVTYVVVHKILRPNDFEVVSTSYPGAQGNAAILPERGEGRRQRRLYIDVIAWLPPTTEGPSPDLALEESKNRPDRSVLQEIAQRLDSFRTDSQNQTALIDTLRKLNRHRRLRHIYIGVGFGVRETTRTSWQPMRVDFIVRITGRNRWDVAFFGEELRYAFRTSSGHTDLPDVWKVKARSQSRTLTQYT